MIWPFRRPQTPPDSPDRHTLTLDLIEQLAQLRGQVRAMETEWDDVRLQIKKGFQRMEKASQRAERRADGDGQEPTEASPAEPAEVLTGFALKLARMRGQA